MRILVESLKRMYKNGQIGKSPSITKEQVVERVKRGSISEAEYEYITGEKFESKDETEDE